MSRIRKKYLGAIPGVLALLALCVAWMVPLMPAQADGGRQINASAACDDQDRVMLTVEISGFTQVTPESDDNVVKVYKDGGGTPIYESGFTGGSTSFLDFVDLGDTTVSHTWKVVAIPYDDKDNPVTAEGTSEPCTTPDSDGDGVPDDQDQCPDTPSGETVDANGCSSSQLDSDGDGVNDAVDNCPNQAGPADNGGCPVVEPPADSDGDGVPDDADQCPGTPAGETVDADGCSDSQKDSDGDGVMNDVDECPNVAGPASNNGCPVVEPPADSDGDGVNDDQDECPDTPADTKVDKKGCPVGNDNPGNNGTIKVDGGEFDSHPDNEPHVGCTFQVDFYNYGKDVGDATVSFELQSPTVDGRTLTVTTGDLTPDIGEDPPGGGTDLDASETYTLAFTGEPHAQGYHVKLTVNAPDSQGSDVKHKVFWVEGCEPDDDEPAEPTVSVTVEGCVEPGETTAASGVITNVDDETDEAVDYDWSVTLTGDDEVVDSGSVENVADGDDAPFTVEGLAPGDYTVTIEGSDGTSASDTFTVEECDTPPGEEPNTYTATAGACDDGVSITNPTGSILTSFTNVDDETDLPAEDISVQAVTSVGDVASGPEDFGTVADGQTAEVELTGLYGGAEYTVQFLDGDTVVHEENVFVEFCDIEPPGEGDVDVKPFCGYVNVTNNEDSTGQFFHGSFDEIEPDGIVPVKPGETVKVKTDRKSLDWVMIWDDGKFTQGENLKVKQECGDTPDNPDNPDNPDQPDTPDNPDTPNWPDTPQYGVPDTGTTLAGLQDSGNGWPLMLFGAGGLAALALTRRVRKIKVMSR